MIDIATLLDRSMILIIASARLRRGSLSHLGIKDLQKIDKYNLYRITVYKKEQEEYITFCTPECTRCIDQYLDWRNRLGEILKPESPLFRLEYDTTDYIRIAKPKPVRPNTISHVVMSLLDKTGIRPRTQFYHRTSLMACHGFRKFFDTQCINHSMNPLYCEYLMGHKTGLIKSYFKPTYQELLEGNDQSLGYKAIISYLTINATSEENRRLREELQKREQQHTAEWADNRDDDVT
jgi:integrase